MAKTVYWKPGLECRTFSNDIAQVKANAIVVGEAPDLCEESSVTKTLIEKIPLFEQRRMRLKRIYRKLDLWSVKHCYLGSTFMYVLHAVMEKGSDAGWAQNMRSLYHRVFREAESLRASAIALPLLGTGIAASDPGLAVSVLVASVLSYTPQGQHISIIVVSRDGHRLDEVETQFMFQLQYPEDCEALFNGTRVTETECDQQFHGIGQQRKTMGYSGYASCEELDLVLKTSAREAKERKRAEGRSGKTQGNQRKDVEIDTRPDQLEKKGNCGIQGHHNSALKTTMEKLLKREATKPIPTTAAPAPALRVDNTLEVDGLFSLETMSLEPTRFGNQGVANSEFLEYNRQLQRVREVAMKKGYTMKETISGRDLFTALSEQLSYVLRLEMDQGQLRTMLARYLRSCQSNNDINLQTVLIGKSMDEVRSAVEKGDDVESDIILSAVSDALKVEVLLLAPSGDEKRYQPSKEKEFLPTLALGTFLERHFISLEHEEGDIPRDIPDTWSRSSRGTVLVTLPEESKEFQQVQQSFLATIGWSLNRRVIQIQRVQSVAQWNHFRISREQMARRYLGLTPESLLLVGYERLVWHGTSGNSVRSICKEGFNRSLCSKSVLYGDGVYFSLTSRYAAQDVYSVPGSEGIKHVFRARVLTGQYTQGESGMRVPPWLDERIPLRFDSVVDDVDNPSIFVTFHDTFAYPEYLIKFT